MLINVIKPNYSCLSDAAKPFLIWAFSIRKQYSSSELPSNAGAANFLDEGDDEAKAPEQNEVRSETKTKPNRYVPHPDVLARSEEEIENFRKEHNIKIHGKDCPRPILNFNETNFPYYINGIIKKQAFEKPTPIQSQSWPIALSGYNMVGIARTGSGKTLGYLLPGIIRMKEYEIAKGKGPSILVLAPTRELALQIDSVAKIFHQYVSSATAYGGAGRDGQLRLLRQYPDICIATPGRLLDFARNGLVNLKNCSYVVLDEADRMLDMGFEPQIREVMDFTQEDKQVLMWSATWPKEIRSLAEDFLKEYIRITVGSEELTANPNIEQKFDFCSKGEKDERLLNFLNSNPKGKTLVFTETKRMADILHRFLRQQGYRCASIHGDKSQTAREEVLYGFRRGQFSVLIATDVAARGLDIDNIFYVINYDMPRTIDSYIHRIGRTARVEKKGVAFSLITDEDTPVAKDLVEVITEVGQQPPEELLKMATSSVRINPRERYPPKTFDRFSSFRNNNFDRSRDSSSGFSYNRRNDFNRRDNFSGRDNFSRRDNYRDDFSRRDNFRDEFSRRDNFRDNFSKRNDNFNKGADDDLEFDDFKRKDDSKSQGRTKNKVEDDFW